MSEEAKEKTDARIGELLNRLRDDSQGIALELLQQSRPEVAGELLWSVKLLRDSVRRLLREEAESQS